MTVILTVILAASGCSGLLLGDPQRVHTPTEVDERQAAQTATDQALARAVDSRLSADESLGGYAIAVSAAKGNVKLRGTVDSFDARDRAVSIVRGVDGVATIDNQIRVDTRQ